MKYFWLVRSEDVHGNSGTGIVAEGVIFSDGICTLHWLSEFTTTTIIEDIQIVGRLHGHNGRTKIVYNLPIMEEKKAA